MNFPSDAGWMFPMFPFCRSGFSIISSPRRCSGGILWGRWFTESNLVPFEPTFAHKSKQTMSRSFCDAVDDAIDELGRRAALGLMCGCTNSFSSTAREGHIEVSVPGYEAPVIYMDRQVKEAKEGFQQAQMLAFMQRMVVAPKCGEDRMISGIKYAAQVRAYRAATAVPVTDEYRQALRLSQRSCCPDISSKTELPWNDLGVL